MSERGRKLLDLLVTCVLRYGQTQDNRFALASLVACQALQGVPRTKIIADVEGKLTELQERVIAVMGPRSKADESYAMLSAFARSLGLAKALAGEKARRFDRERATAGLRRLAPELAQAIDTCDLRLAYDFLKPQHALSAA